MNPEQQPDDPPLSAYEGGPLGAGIDWADPDSRLAPLYFSAGGVGAVALLGLAFFLFSVAPLGHTDFWAHLKYGEWLAANRALPDREPLSPFTDQRHRMFDAQWLTQVGYHALFRAGEALARGGDTRRLEGGVEFVRLAHQLAAVAVLGFVGLACRRAADSVPWAVLGILLTLALMLTPLTVQRPQVFALACFAALLCGLSRPVPSRRALVWVPLLLVLWANLHGSFVVGLGLLGAALVGRVIEVLRADEGSARAAWRDSAVRRLVVALGASVVAVAVLNPLGPQLYLDVVRFGGHPNLRTVVEWQPLDFSQPRGGHWGYLATIVLLVFTQLVSPRPFGPFQMLLIVTLGVWPLFQQRAMAWWVPVVPWLVAPHWVAAAERWGLTAPGGPPDFRRTALAALLAVLAVVAAPASDWLKTGSPRPLAESVHRGTPVSIAAALRGEVPPDPERVKNLARAVREWHGGRFAGRVFASEVQGEYLLRALPADAPVLMFNHAQLFTADHWNECIAVKAAAPGWWEILDRHRVGLVVVEADGHAKLCEELRSHPGWAVVVDESAAPARDPLARLFVAIRRPTAPPTPEPKGGKP